MIQLQFLNKVLSSGNSSLLFDNNLNDEFFSDYKKEYNFIIKHFNQYGTIPDQYTFLDNFPTFDIIAVNESNNYLIDKLFEDYKQRFLAKNFNSIKNYLNDGKVDEAMQLFINSSTDAIKVKHINAVDILKDTSRYNLYVEKTQDFNKFFIKTGFKELDDIIGGWDRKEELATIVARPGVGKTQLAIKFALEAAKQNLKVGMYSGEMSVDQVGYRLDTFISHISNFGLNKGVASFQNEYKKHIDSLAQNTLGSLKVLTPAMIDGPATVTALRSFIDREELDILFIDQHSLLEDERRGRTPIERAANISKDLKNLQVLKQIPIIAVSQQNRSSTDEKIGTENIAQSDRIGQDSTIVLFLEKNKDGDLIIDLVKSRNSINGKKIKYRADFDKGTFEWIPADETEEMQAKIDAKKNSVPQDDEDNYF